LSRKSERQAARAASGCVAERFYGYRRGGVTRNEEEDTENGESEFPKYRHRKVRSSCDLHLDIFLPFSSLLLRGSCGKCDARPGEGLEIAVEEII
jgi:hypothetical protein